MLLNLLFWTILRLSFCSCFSIQFFVSSELYLLFLGWELSILSKVIRNTHIISLLFSRSSAMLYLSVFFWFNCSIHLLRISRIKYICNRNSHFQYLILLIQKFHVKLSPYILQIPSSPCTPPGTHSNLSVLSIPSLIFLWVIQQKIVPLSWWCWGKKPSL